MMNDSQLQSERDALFTLVQSHIKEQRAARRWKLLFKTLTYALVIYFVVLPLATFTKDMAPGLSSAQAHTALIDIQGEIDSSAQANANAIIESLESAYRNKNVKGIVLRINSPGGSAVQARQVYQAMHRLREKTPAIKVHAVIEDMGTSAAYLIAAGADKIYSDKSSLVGSIGVLIDSYGFPELMQKLGVERRLYHAGEHKGILDPYSPRVPAEEAHIQAQLDAIHQLFKENVRQGRGERLIESPELFTGLFWTGEEAYKMGLTDGFGDTRYVATEIIKAETIVDYTPVYSVLDQISSRIQGSLKALFKSSARNSVQFRS